MPSVLGALGPIVQGTGNEQVAGGGTGGAGPLDLSSATFAGGTGSSTGVVATQSQSGGNTVVHLQDGSTLTVVGTTHVDASFFH